MSLLNDASLVMIPSGYKDTKLYSAKPINGDGDFTFSRGSNLAATRVNSEGLIEKGRSNQLLNSVWAGVGSYIAPTNYSIINFASGTFDAGSQANSIRFTSPTTADRIMITQSPSITGVIVGSVYVEEIHSGSLDVANIIARTSGSSSVIAYLENGVVVDALHPVSAGNTYAIVINVTSAVTFRFGCGTSGPVAADVTLSKPQVEYGLVNTDYIETTTTTAQAGILEDMPRLDYSGGASCPSLLLEPQRTNLFETSEYFGASSWSQTNITLITNDSESVEGVDNATLMYPNATSSGATYLYNTTSGSSSKYTISAFVKADGKDVCWLYIDSSSVNGLVYFDLSDESIQAVAGGNGTPTGTITDIGNNWYRVTYTMPLSAAISAGSGIGVSDAKGSLTVTKSDEDGILVYGLQLEAGSYSTSYIPTYGSSVTRSADSCSKTGISSLIGQTEGTLFLDFRNIQENGTTYISSLDNGTASERIEVFGFLGDLSVSVRDGGVQQVNMISSVNLAEVHKMAFAYKQNDFALYIDGTQISLDNSGTVPSTDEIKLFGRYDEANGGGSQELNQAILFPTRLTNDQLADLTTL